jgi:hypothetical protein
MTCRYPPTTRRFSLDTPESTNRMNRSRSQGCRLAFLIALLSFHAGAYACTPYLPLFRGYSVHFVSGDNTDWKVVALLDDVAWKFSLFAQSSGH